MSDILKSRKGTVIKDIGSWEKEQLAKEKFEIPKSTRRINTQGRKRHTIESNPMLYITECGSGDRYMVAMKNAGFGNKTFLFKKYPGGKEEALQEAIKYRNEMVAQRDKL